MSLTIRELVAIPHLATRVHAGHAGLDREVCFAAPCEMAAPWEWLGPGDLLLTSGIGVPERPHAQAEYVRQLAAAGIAGVSVGEPADTPALSTEMVRAAERVRLPLLLTAYEVPWAVLSRAVVDARTDESRAHVLLTERLYHRVREVTARGGGSAALVAALGDELGCRLSIFDNARRRQRLADATGDGAEPAVERALQEALALAIAAHGGRMPARVQLEAPPPGALVVPVPATRPASLLVVPRARAELPDADVLQHVVTIVALELEREERQRAQRTRLGADTLAELLDAPMDAAVVRDRLARHGIGSRRMVLAAWASAGPADHDVVHDALVDAGIAHLLLERDRTMVTLLAEEAELATLAGSLPSAVRAGVSSPFTRPTQATDALRQAVWALQAAGPGARWLARYGEAAAPFLPRTLAEAQGAVEQVLGALLRYDAAHGSELVHTLRVFLQCNRSWKRAAELLFVHKQTLVYRMQRIEQLTGRPLGDTQHVAELWFGLRTLDLTGGRAPEDEIAHRLATPSRARTLAATSSAPGR